MTGAASGRTTAPGAAPPGPDTERRNLWVVSATSFLTDVSSQLILNVLPLFLAHVLGARTATIGLIEGVAASLSSVVRWASGTMSDRLQTRKWPAVGGYAVSALARPLFLLSASWMGVAVARWTDRLGKGVRTAPRDALIADSIARGRRGWAFGFHRTADTAGALLGLGAAIAVVTAVQPDADVLAGATFRTLVWWSLLPAVLGVVILAVGARDVASPPSTAGGSRRRLGAASLRDFGRPFLLFLGISAVFDLGAFSDAFLVLRAHERGLSVVEVLWALAAFRASVVLLAVPAGRASDRVGAPWLLGAGWTVLALVYLGFARVVAPTHVVLLFVGYGLYHGLVAGAARAVVADYVPADLRGSAYGTYHAVLALLDVPASLLAGVLWEGLGGWPGLGPAAPFYAGAGFVLLATALLPLLPRTTRPNPQRR